MLSKFFNKHLASNCYRFSSVQNQQTIYPDQKEYYQEQKKKREEILERLNPIEEFRDGLRLYNERKFSMANTSFQRVARILEHAGQEKSEDYRTVLKKLVGTQVQLRQYGNADKLLSNIVQNVQSNTTNEGLIYQEMNNLFLYRMSTNIRKAIMMGKALLSESEKDKIPLYYQKSFLFNLGTSYTLNGQYGDGKLRLRECLKMQPNSILKGQALNNLATASILHKYPKTAEDSEEEVEISEEEGEKEATKSTIEYESFESEGEELEPIKHESITDNYPGEQIDKDYEQCLSLYKQSILAFEDVDNIQDVERQTALRTILDPQNHELSHEQLEQYKSEKIQFIRNPYSGMPLNGIVDYHHLNSIDNQEFAAFWLLHAHRFFERYDPGNIEHTLMTMAIYFTSEKKLIEAEGLYRTCLELLEHVSSEAGIILMKDSYHKVQCLRLYGNMLQITEKREAEADRLHLLAHQLEDRLPYWSHRLTKCCIPKLEL